jgi:hypothetical protein
MNYVHPCGYMSNSRICTKHWGTCNHMYEELVIERDRLREALQDFADHGGRFDTMPSLSGDLTVEWMYEYLDHIDSNIRQRAARAL